MWNRVIVMTVTLGVTYIKDCLSEPLGGVGNKWPRPTITQDYNSILLGIEQRLRGLEPIRHTISRTEISVQSLANRIDLVETRLQNIQSSFQDTLHAVSTAVKSSEMKYAFLLEQLSQKVEAGFDRFTHRLNTMESRNEALLNKLQNQLDLNFVKVDNKQNGHTNDLIKIGSNLEIVQTHVSKQDERNNQTFQLFTRHFQDIHSEHGQKQEHLKNITNLLTTINNSRTDSYTQNDAQSLPEESLQMIKTEISSETHKISAKIHNMYNDLWRTVKDIEVIIKTGFEDYNSTSRDLYKGLSELLTEERRNSESFMDVVMRSVLTTVENILNDLKIQVNDSFKGFKTTQELQGQFCQTSKNLIETKMARILERIYDSTDKCSKQIVDMAELVKAHNKQFIQSRIDTTDLLITLAQESSQDHKQLDDSITDVSETCQDLQNQTQEMNRLYLKNQGAIREIKNLLLSIKELSNFNNSSMVFSNENLHTIQGNCSNGVIKIKTNVLSPNSTLMNETSQVAIIPLEGLNKTITTTELVSVTGETRKNDEKEENSNRNFEKAEDGFDVQEEWGADEEKPIDVTQLLLAYIKVLHGNLTPTEFLSEAVPGNSYESFDDMIKHLQRAGNVPKETIREIEMFSQEQDYKDTFQTDMEIIKKLQKSSDSDNEDENYDDED